MPQLPEPTRLQIDLGLYLGDEARPLHGAGASAWTTGPASWALTSRALSMAEQAECACPTDCIRDHEND